ncbi:MAG TPA: hypothetical protein VEK84_12730 [Terriglobales bacterium]|nr:hypothetical protein [Terriglobales bacterium]
MNSETILWCLHPILQSVVAVVLWRRGLHKKFPVFFAYLIAQNAYFAACFPLRGNYNWYFWVYWLGAAISAVLGFKVIHEIFLDVFRPYHTLKDLGTVVFKWAGVVMLLVSVVVAFSDSLNRDPLVQAVVTLQRSVRLVQFGLTLFLLLFSRFLGVSRRQLSFGIALGFGFFASTELLFLALASGGFLHKEGFTLANLAAYNLSIAIWIGYSLTRIEARHAAANPLQTQRWEQGLADIQHPVPSDSLIPMFESMVERAISRSSNLDQELPMREQLAQPPKSFSTASSGSGSKMPG